MGGVPGAGKQSGVEQEQGGRANRSDDPTFEMKPADQIERPGLFAQFENSGRYFTNGNDDGGGGDDDDDERTTVA